MSGPRGNAEDQKREEQPKAGRRGKGDAERDRQPEIDVGHARKLHQRIVGENARVSD